MSRVHEQIVDHQFGPQAKAYVESAVHANGEDLQRLSRIVAQAVPAHALDLGTGGGHVAYLLAAHAKRVTASDLSEQMLRAVAVAARDRGLDRIETARAPAESLPFGDASFDFLACRFSAHHWRDFEAGLRQARRVVSAGAPAIFIDACAPEPALLDSHLQAVELLRDTSHVRDYRPSEWLAALGRCGFVAQAVRTWRIRMDFGTWVARMRTPPAHVQAIRALQEAASASVRSHFAIEADGSFMLDVAMFETAAQ